MDDDDNDDDDNDDDDNEDDDNNGKSSNCTTHGGLRVLQTEGRHRLADHRRNALRRPLQASALPADAVEIIRRRKLIAGAVTGRSVTLTLVDRRPAIATAERQRTKRQRKSMKGSDCKQRGVSRQRTKRRGQPRSRHRGFAATGGGKSAMKQERGGKSFIDEAFMVEPQRMAEGRTLLRSHDSCSLSDVSSA